MQQYSINRRHKPEYERILRSAIQLVDAGEQLFDEHDIDVILGNHPVYLPGVISSLGFSRGKNVYTFGTGRRDQTLVFGRWNDRSPQQFHADRSCLDQYLNEPLTPVERDRIETIMQGRADGSKRRITYFNTGNQMINIDRGNHIIGLFTNLIWDAATDVSETVFSDPFSWIKTSIEAVPPDAVMIIKPHPAEKYRGTRERIGDWIREEYDTLPDNIKLLQPDTEISTYQLLNNIDLASVWTSTVGVEAAYHGVPVVPSAAAHYRGFGFTEDVDSIGQYAQVMQDASEVRSTDRMVNRARRYAYYMFIQAETDFPFFKSEEGFEISLIEAESNDVAPGNAEFDRLIKQIISDEPPISKRNISASD